MVCVRSDFGNRNVTNEISFQISGKQNCVGGVFLTNDFSFIPITQFFEEVWRKNVYHWVERNSIFFVTKFTPLMPLPLYIFDAILKNWYTNWTVHVCVRSDIWNRNVTSEISFQKGEQNCVGGDFVTNDFSFMAITPLFEGVWRIIPRPL